MLTCNSSNDGDVLSKRSQLKDLAAIQKRGVLRILTENGAVSFYEYKDKFLGFEYDILDTFASCLNAFDENWNEFIQLFFECFYFFGISVSLSWNDFQGDPTFL